jgi:RecB family exonuclease
MICPRCAWDQPHLHVTDVLQIAGLSEPFLGPDAEAALARGTAVHAWLAAPDPKPTQIQEDALPYVQAWQRWADTIRPIILEVEVPVRHVALRYAGTVDAIVRIGSTTYLVDYKTGTAPDTVGLQTIAYRTAINAYGVVGQAVRPAYLPLLHRACMELHGDGTYRWMPASVPSLAHDEQVWRAALTIAQWRQAHGRI